MSEFHHREALFPLRDAHRALDDAIRALQSEACPDELALTRLKRRKLALKDTIVRIESAAIPDGVA